MANKFRYNLRKDLEQFIASGKLVLGICNGFQIMVKMGILPAFDGTFFKQSVTLVQNESKQFESRWVKLKPLENNCVFTNNYKETLELPCRHGEGKFVPENQKVLDRLIEEKLISFVYDPNEYPNCPNGATHGIAGISDQTGRIYGMMPHPECHIFDYHHPRWTRGEKPKENGLKLFKNAVEFARKKL
jgi:phosphoribosylformylglycinamidine synthase